MPGRPGQPDYASFCSLHGGEQNEYLGKRGLLHVDAVDIEQPLTDLHALMRRLAVHRHREDLHAVRLLTQADAIPGSGRGR